MPQPIEFWFDFASPYAYLAGQEIDDLGARHGREVLWRPFLLGAVFKVTGMRALTDIPIRGDYARHDWERLARRRNVPFRMPSVHPINSAIPSRACLWATRKSERQGAELAKALFQAYFAQNRDITSKEEVIRIAEGLGHQPAEIASALDDDEIKQAFRSQNDEALRRQIFGAPFTIVDGEGFWGYDRFPLVEEWLERGGW